jgi:uncharacterized membrane protein YraQ (UPF0718 family)
MEGGGMKRDPICGMPGVTERHGQWFCGEGCAAAFARRQAAQAAGADAAPSHAERLRVAGWRRALDPWVWVPLSGLLLATAGLWASGWWLQADQVSAIYVGYLRKVAVPFLVGLLLGGLIDHFVPREYIVKLLSGPRKRVIARATVLGFLASSCSHGCLALTIELYRKGASIPAAVSFLLASPWASMSLTLILLGLFGLKGLVIVGGALAIAFATGLIFQRLAARGLIEPSPHTLVMDDAFSIWHDLSERWRQYRWTKTRLAQDARGVLRGTIPLGRMVLGWVQLGLIVSSVLGGVVPHRIFEQWMGPSFAGLLVTLFAAALIEVCSEGTAPLAFEFYRHTGALGNAFAFLMGGVVTDYTELAAVWANIGRRTVLWILLITLPLVIAVGSILNLCR